MILPEKKLYRGVPLHDFTDRQALQACKLLIESRTKRSHIITLTPAMYIEARQSEVFKRVLDEAKVVVPESTLLRLYSSVFGPPFSKILSGRFLAEELLVLCARKKRSVVLFGSSPENRDQAREAIADKYYGIEVQVIKGDYVFSRKDDSQYVIRQLDELHPDFAVMAGVEVEAEKWINQWLVKTGVNVGLVGNFGQTLERIAHDSEDEIAIQKMATKIGIAWALRLKSMDPARRKRWIISSLRILRLCKDDFIDSFGRTR